MDAGLAGTQRSVRGFGGRGSQDSRRGGEVRAGKEPWRATAGGNTPRLCCPAWQGTEVGARNRCRGRLLHWTGWASILQNVWAELLPWAKWYRLWERTWRQEAERAQVSGPSGLRSVGSLPTAWHSCLLTGNPAVPAPGLPTSLSGGPPPSHTPPTFSTSPAQPAPLGSGTKNTILSQVEPMLPLALPQVWLERRSVCAPILAGAPGLRPFPDS